MRKKMMIFQEFFPSSLKEVGSLRFEIDVKKQVVLETRPSPRVNGYVENVVVFFPKPCGFLVQKWGTSSSWNFYRRGPKLLTSWSLHTLVPSVKGVVWQDPISILKSTVFFYRLPSNMKNRLEHILAVT